MSINPSVDRPISPAIACEDLADLMFSRMVGRSDMHAIQTADGYVRYDVPVTHELLLRHLMGEVRVGTYCIDVGAASGQASWKLVLDIDAVQGSSREAVLRGDPDAVSELIKIAFDVCEWFDTNLGSRTIVSYGGGKGLHVICPTGPADPGALRRAGGAGLAALGWSLCAGSSHKWTHPEHAAFHIEVFPKHDHIEPGRFGTQVGLPLGRSAETGRWGHFLPDRARDLDSSDDPWLALKCGTRRGSFVRRPDVEVSLVAIAESWDWPDPEAMGAGDSEIWEFLVEEFGVDQLDDWADQLSDELASASGDLKERIELAGLRMAIEAAYRNQAKGSLPPVGERRSVMIRCPSPDHEDQNPSTSWDLEQDVFYCHSCGIGGDVFNAWGLVFGLSPAGNFPELLLRAGEWLGLADAEDDRVELEIPSQSVPRRDCLPPAAVAVQAVSSTGRESGADASERWVPGEDRVVAAVGCGRLEAEAAAIAALPCAAREFVDDAAQAFQVAPGLVMQLVVGAMSVVVNERRVMGDYWGPSTVRGNLYLLLVAKSGEGKSVVFRPVFAPVELLMVQRANESREDVLDSVARLQIAELDLDNVKKAAKKAPPGGHQLHSDVAEDYRRALAEHQTARAGLVREYQGLVSDVTPEAVFDVLEANSGNTAAVVSAEMDVLALASRYAQKGDAANLDLLLAGFSGDTTRKNRVSQKDGARVIEDPRLVFVAATQPAVAQRMMCDPEAKGRGFFARFMLVEPPSMIGFKDHTAQRQLNDLAEAGWAGLISDLGRIPSGTAITFDADATRTLQEWENTLEVNLRPGGVLDGFAAFVAKLTTSVARLSLILAAADGHNAVDVDTVSRAIAIGEWWLAEQVHLHVGAEREQDEQARLRILRLVKKKDLEKFHFRDVRDTVESYGRSFRAPGVKELFGAMVDDGLLSSTIAVDLWADDSNPTFTVLAPGWELLASVEV